MRPVPMQASSARFLTTRCGHRKDDGSVAISESDTPVTPETLLAMVCEAGFKNGPFLTLVSSNHE